MLHRVAGMCVILLMLLTSGLAAQSVDFLPDDAQEIIQDIQAARADLADAADEVRDQLSMQPYETETEFVDRVNRAIERAASREQRFLEFQLEALAEEEFRLDQEAVELFVAGEDASGRVPMIAEAMLGGGRMIEAEFYIGAGEGISDANAMAEMVSDQLFDASMHYRITPQGPDAWQLAVTEVTLFDSRSAQGDYQRIPARAVYTWGEYRDFAAAGGGGSYDFEGGVIPADFLAHEDRWTVTSDEAEGGMYAAVSADIGHRGRSELLLPVASSTSRRTLLVRFEYRVSSESNFDYLRFSVDDEELESWSGDVDWNSAEFEVEVPAGAQPTLIWAYTKDGSVNRGEDRAWIDNVRIDFGL